MYAYRAERDEKQENDRKKEIVKLAYLAEHLI